MRPAQGGENPREIAVRCGFEMQRCAAGGMGEAQGGAGEEHALAGEQFLEQAVVARAVAVLSDMVARWAPALPGAFDRGAPGSAAPILERRAQGL